MVGDVEGEGGLQLLQVGDGDAAERDGGVGRVGDDVGGLDDDAGVQGVWEVGRGGEGMGEEEEEGDEGEGKQGAVVGSEVSMVRDTGG